MPVGFKRTLLFRRFDSAVLTGGIYMMPWDKYEIALLIESYFVIEHGLRRRGNELKRLSVKLRRMALNRGMVINSAFRNYNGMNRKVHNIGDIMSGTASADMPQLKEFSAVVDLYLNHPDKFALLSRKAHEMCKPDSPCHAEQKACFAAWLSDKHGLKDSASTGYLKAIDGLSPYFRKKNAETTELWTADDCKSVNRLRQILEKDEVFRRKFPAEFSAAVRAVKLYYAFVKETKTENDFRENAT